MGSFLSHLSTTAQQQILTGPLEGLPLPPAQGPSRFWMGFPRRPGVTVC